MGEKNEITDFWLSLEFVEAEKRSMKKYMLFFWIMNGLVLFRILVDTPPNILQELAVYGFFTFVYCPALGILWGKESKRKTNLAIIIAVIRLLSFLPFVFMNHIESFNFSFFLAFFVLLLVNYIAAMRAHKKLKRDYKEMDLKKPASAL